MQDEVCLIKCDESLKGPKYRGSQDNKGEISRNKSKKQLPMIKKQNFKEMKLIISRRAALESPFTTAQEQSSNTTMTNNQIETAPTLYGGSSQMGHNSNSGFETPARQTRETRDSNEFTSMSSQMPRNQSRESVGNIQRYIIDTSQIFCNPENSSKGKVKLDHQKAQSILYEARDKLEQDQARKTHFLEKQTNEISGLLNNHQQQNGNLFMTMRAYNMKKARRSSNSNQSNASSYRCPDEQENTQTMENQDERTSQGGQTNINSSIQNSEKTPNIMDKAAMTASQLQLEQQIRSTSKQQSSRRLPTGAALGLNVMRFPPGFFSDNIISDSRLGKRQKSVDKQNLESSTTQQQYLASQNSIIESNVNSVQSTMTKKRSQQELIEFLNGGTLPKVLEMPSLKEIKSEAQLQINNINNSQKKQRINPQESLLQQTPSDQQILLGSHTGSFSMSNLSQTKFQTATKKYDINKHIQNSLGSSSKFDVDHNMRLVKVKSEPNLKKPQNPQKQQNLLPLINKNFFIQTLQNNENQVLNNEESSQFVNKKQSRIKLLQIPKVREASQQEQMRPHKYQEKIENMRQQSAPMPPEALLKKKDERELNNFIDGFEINKSKIQLIVTRKKDNIQQILKNHQIHQLSKKPSFESITLQSQSNQGEKFENIKKFIENNKFLSRIQEKHQFVPLSKQVSPKYGNQIPLITLNKIRNFPASNQPSIDHQKQNNEERIQILNQQKNIKKILLASNSHQTIITQKSQNESDQKQSSIMMPVKKFNVKPFPKKVLPALKLSESKIQLKDNQSDMLTTFGPAQVQTSKLSIFQQNKIHKNSHIKRDSSTSSIEDSKTPQAKQFNNNQDSNLLSTLQGPPKKPDDVEMTFGLISKSNFGNTISNSSLRESSHNGNQSQQNGFNTLQLNGTSHSGNKIFGATFMNSLHENAAGAQTLASPMSFNNQQSFRKFKFLTSQTLSSNKIQSSCSHSNSQNNSQVSL
eukprot:403376663